VQATGEVLYQACALSLGLVVEHTKPTAKEIESTYIIPLLESFDTRHYGPQWGSCLCLETILTRPHLLSTFWKTNSKIPDEPQTLSSSSDRLKIIDRLFCRLLLLVGSKTKPFLRLSKPVSSHTPQPSSTPSSSSNKRIYGPNHKLYKTPNYQHTVVFATGVFQLLSILVQQTGADQENHEVLCHYLYPMMSKALVSVGNKSPQLGDQGSSSHNALWMSRRAAVLLLHSIGSLPDPLVPHFSQWVPDTVSFLEEHRFDKVKKKKKKKKKKDRKLIVGDR
jgi:hypothetical protein